MSNALDTDAPSLHFNIFTLFPSVYGLFTVNKMCILEEETSYNNHSDTSEWLQYISIASSALVMLITVAEMKVYPSVNMASFSTCGGFNKVFFKKKKIKIVSVKFESAAISWRLVAHCRLKVCNRIVPTSIHPLPLSAQRGRCWTLWAALVPHRPACPKVNIQRQTTIPTEIHT